MVTGHVPIDVSETVDVLAKIFYSSPPIHGLGFLHPALIFIKISQVGDRPHLQLVV